MASHPDERQAFHIEGRGLKPVGPGKDTPLAASFDPTILDFGHYIGRTIEELANIDPDYLHWLQRHAVGTRYRSEINRVLGVVPLSTDWNR